MKSEFLERANRIAADNISSQQRILRDTLDLLIAFSRDELSSLGLAQDLKSISTAIANAQSQMSALSNICRLVVLASNNKKPEEIEDYLKNLRNKIETSSSQTAIHASKLIADKNKYATISQSEFVTKAFEAAADENKHVTVFVMESRPLLEGRQTAKALMKMGHRVILVSDASIGFFINDIAAAFTGADSILSDGVLINKIGSSPLAICCAAAKKKFFAVTSVLKFDSDKKSIDFINKEGSADEICTNPESSEWSPSVEVRNFYFDKVSPELITAFVTETGCVSPISGLEELNSAMRKIYGG